MPFFGNYHQKIQYFENAFLIKAHGKFTPIGPKIENWFVIRDPHEILASHRNYLLLFTDSELAYSFLYEIEALVKRVCWVDKYPWQDISDFCKSHCLFAGVVVDWLVREDFSFHSFEPLA